ncbi:MAG: TldD/PmbA family protein [Bacillota bacterium]
MEKLLEYGLELAGAAGAEFAELLATSGEVMEMRMENGSPWTETRKEGGLSVRVLKAGRWGFASCPAGGKAVVKALVASALAAAEFSPGPLRPIGPGAVDSGQDHWQGPCAVDPFSLPPAELRDVLREADEAMAAVGSLDRFAFLRFRRENRFYVNSRGARLSQTKTLSGGGVRAQTVAQGRLLQRSWPAPGGSYAGQGYEYIQELDLPGNARRLAGEALALEKAPPCPAGIVDLILQGSFLAAQLHHSLARRALLGEPGSVPPQRADNFSLGSALLNVDADARLPGGAGSYAYDWEGVPAQTVSLVRGGRLVQYCSGRMAAAIGRKSTGAMRSHSYQSPPRPCLSNLVLHPGAGSLQDLVAGVERGLLLDTVSAIAPGPQLQDFVARAEAGWLIEKGKLRQMVGAPIFRGYPTAFWSGCDAVAGSREQQYLGMLEEGIPVGYLVAPVRIRGVKVGASL